MSDEKLDEQEAAKRRDEALKRALGMPHKPHKPSDKKGETKGGSRRQDRKA